MMEKVDGGVVSSREVRGRDPNNRVSKAGLLSLEAEGEGACSFLGAHLEFRLRGEKQSSGTCISSLTLGKRGPCHNFCNLEEYVYHKHIYTQ